MGGPVFLPDHWPGNADRSAIANLSVLGYDPIAHFSAAAKDRGVLEAASLGMSCPTQIWGARINLICVEEGRVQGSHSSAVNPEAHI